jgi:hypothetical protein
VQNGMNRPGYMYPIAQSSERIVGSSGGFVAGLAAAQPLFEVVQRIVHLDCQRRAFCANDDVLIITRWKFTISANALPQDQWLDMRGWVVLHREDRSVRHSKSRYRECWPE